MEENQELKDKLQILATEAKTNREKEEKSLRGKPEEAPNLVDWTRNWRKQFGAYSLACDVTPATIPKQKSGKKSHKTPLNNGVLTLESHSQPKKRVKNDKIDARKI